MKKQWGKGDIVGSSDFNRYEQSNKEVFGKTENHIIDFNNPHKVTKSNIGLENVDNTSDLDKPVSHSLQAELDKKLNKEELNSHITQETVISQGVHGVRYFDKKLQAFVDGNWIDIIDDLPAIRVKVFAETGTVVTATKGETVIKGTTVDGFVFLKLTDYGYWDIQGINPGGEVSTVQTININIMKDYEITLEFYKADFNIKTDKGALISCVYNGQVIEQQTSDGINNKFTVKKKGLYTFYAEYANARSETIIKEAVAGTIIYNITLNFCKLEITVETGSNVVATLDTYRLEQVSVGEKVLFYLPKLGTWNIVCVKDNKTKTILQNCPNYITYFLTVKYFYIYTVTIDTTNPNPETSVSYADDAVGMIAKSSAWDDFFGHYPVLFKNGVEVGKLKKTDFTKFENGLSADITSGNAGDVMIAFPRRGVKISTNGNIITVSMTDNPDNSSFKYLAHTRGNQKKDKFYLGAYKGYYDGLKIRSLSGKTATKSYTIGDFRNYARNNGSGYDLSAFYQLTFRQVMYLLKYKNLDSQTALGQGYVSGTNITEAATGGTDTKGMDFGETTGKVQMKLFGLEDYWGNVTEWVDGVRSDASRNILTGTDNFNDSGTGYINNGQGLAWNLYGYMSKPLGTTETGFILKEDDASQSTYFCDYATRYASCVFAFGGFYNSGDYTGVFYLLNSFNSNSVGLSISSRLMYL